MILSTQGRGFYVLDDMPLVRALDPSKFHKDDAAKLFPVKTVLRIPGPGEYGGRNPIAGQNPADGVFYYFFKEKP